MTVEVETPQGLRTGSSVREVKIVNHDGILDKLMPSVGPQAHVELKGEAVAVDIAPGQTMFALLSGADGEVDYAKRLPDRALWSRTIDEDKPPPAIRLQVELWPDAIKTIGLVNSNPLPMLVRFGDPRDPKSVEQVAPGDLAKTFGPGVKLRRISIALTREDTTVGIEKRLGWVSNSYYFDKMLDGKRFSDGSSLANRLTPGSFRQGNRK